MIATSGSIPCFLWRLVNHTCTHHWRCPHSREPQMSALMMGQTRSWDGFVLAPPQLGCSRQSPHHSLDPSAHWTGRHAPLSWQSGELQQSPASDHDCASACSCMIAHFASDLGPTQTWNGNSSTQTMSCGKGDGGGQGWQERALPFHQMHQRLGTICSVEFV